MKHLPDNFNQQKRSLLALDPRGRVEAILASKKPAEVVRSLAVQEFFLTLTEAGLSRSAPLLRFATRHQIDFLLDVDAWNREGFDPARFARWLENFRKADAEVVLRWLSGADESNVVLAISRLIHVYKLDESTDESFWPPEQKIPSLDGLYFLEGREETPRPALKALWDGLGLLRESRPSAYEALLEQVMWIVPAEQEELAFERRESRLAERGFPSFDEALEVWAASPESSPEGRAALARRVHVSESSPPAPEETARALIPADGEGLDSLNQALGALPLAAQERIVHNIVRLGNRFAVASLAHLGDAQTHQEGLTAAFSHVNLGLALLSHKQPEEFAQAALKSLSVFELSHAGVGAVLERVGRAERLGRSSEGSASPDLKRLDLPIRQTLEGLLSPRPFLRLEEQDRPFRRLEDLREVDEHLGAAEALISWGLPEVHPKPLGYRDLGQIEWSTLALTALARRLLGDPLDRLGAGPLDLSQGRPALERLSQDDLLEQACQAEGLESARPYLAARVEQALTYLAGHAEVDPLQIRALLFR